MNAAEQMSNTGWKGEGELGQASPFDFREIKSIFL